MVWLGNCLTRLAAPALFTSGTASSLLRWSHRRSLAELAEVAANSPGMI